MLIKSCSLIGRRRIIANKVLLRCAGTLVKERSPEIQLTSEEKELFNMLLSVSLYSRNGTTVRVAGKSTVLLRRQRKMYNMFNSHAGGWVRDKLLSNQAKDDVDIVLDNVSGLQFATYMSSWSQKTKQTPIKFGVIRQNPEKSKHLETGSCKLSKFSRRKNIINTPNDMSCVY